MTSLQWLDCWDRLRTQVSTGAQTSFGRNQLLAIMDTIEREMVRKAEREDGEIRDRLHPYTEDNDILTKLRTREA